ncbi:hypothetical protein B5X24_HaOG207538 [Helicoverpa armigera]|nr:hypothetical protein B5X24_HaOG207538 [Helicoverpa armigera]
MQKLMSLPMQMEKTDLLQYNVSLGYLHIAIIRIKDRPTSVRHAIKQMSKECRVIYIPGACSCIFKMAAWLASSMKEDSRSVAVQLVLAAHCQPASRDRAHVTSVTSTNVFFFDHVYSITIKCIL